MKKTRTEIRRRIYLLAALGIVFSPNAFAADTVYQQARQMFQRQAYRECAAACTREIDAQGPVADAALYELKADCLEALRLPEQAAQTLEHLPANQNAGLTAETRARLALKIGNFYRRAGLLSRALRQYEAVAQGFEKTFPDRFARYARSNAGEIRAGQRALVTGRASVACGQSSPDASVRVVNGFETSEAVCDRNGRFSVPLFGSTPGTLFAVMLSRPGMMPVIRTMQFDGAAQIALGSVIMADPIEAGCGVIAGVAAATVSGGKRRPHRGISRFISGHTIQLQPVPASAPHAVQTDENGFFAAAVSPGTYRVDDGYRRRELQVRAGRAVLLTVTAPGTLVD